MNPALSLGNKTLLCLPCCSVGQTTAKVYTLAFKIFHALSSSQQLIIEVWYAPFKVWLICLWHHHSVLFRGKMMSLVLCNNEALATKSLRDKSSYEDLAPAAITKAKLVNRTKTSSIVELAECFRLQWELSLNVVMGLSRVSSLARSCTCSDQSVAVGDCLLLQIKQSQKSRKSDLVVCIEGATYCWQCQTRWRCWGQAMDV